MPGVAGKALLSPLTGLPLASALPRPSVPEALAFLPSRTLASAALDVFTRLANRPSPGATSRDGPTLMAKLRPSLYPITCKKFASLYWLSASYQGEPSGHPHVLLANASAGMQFKS